MIYSEVESQQENDTVLIDLKKRTYQTYSSLKLTEVNRTKLIKKNSEEVRFYQVLRLF